MMAIEWLEWVAYKERKHIRHQPNNTANCPWTGSMPKHKLSTSFTLGFGMDMIVRSIVEKNL